MRTHAKEISTLINLALASAKLKNLTVYEKHQIFKIRPQIHIILQSATGSGKSTILNQVAERVNLKQSVYTNLTFASFVGTIDEQTKLYVPGAAWDSRNSLLLIDEWDNQSKHQLMNALLQLLENGKFARRLGRTCFSGKLKDGDLFVKPSKDGIIDIRSRFSLILATMHNIWSSPSLTLNALTNRCIPYRFKLSMKELDMIANGQQLFKYENLLSDKCNGEIEVNVYNRIRKLCYPLCNEETYLRTIGEICRIYNITHKWNERLFKWIIALKNSYQKRQEYVQHYFSAYKKTGKMASKWQTCRKK